MPRLTKPWLPVLRFPRCPVAWQWTNIMDLARKYVTADTPGLAIQWLFFGHNDQIYTKDEPVVTRFIRRNADM